MFKLAMVAFLLRVPGTVSLLVALLFAAQAQAQPFDLDTGNAGVDVVAVTGAPVIFEFVSATAGDATLIYRYGILITNAWFDATAPYHATAVGVYARLGRRPAEEATNRNINIAVLYSSLRVLSSFLPSYRQTWRQMLIDVGLNPDDNSTDIATPIGLGNVAANAVIAGRMYDGMNEAGYVGRQYHPMPYADYTDYKPVNAADVLRDPSRWQPDIQRKGLGLYKVQHFVTPQYALVEPYSYTDPRQFDVPPPYNSQFHNYSAYRQQAEEVLEASANLTDEQKVKAELFDNKILSLANATVYNAMYVRNLSLLEFIQLDFLVNMAAFDAGIFTWYKKYEYDAVRPFSAIRKLYKDRWVKAWGGPGKGTVRLRGREWTSYLEEADHPEYPSGSSCFCAAHAQSARLFLGDDRMEFPYPIPAGWSRIEPGITPAKDMVLSYSSWTEYAKDCGQSRVWSGVHFQAAVDASAAVCPEFGDLAYEYLSSLIDGSAPVRGPSKGRPVSILPR